VLADRRGCHGRDGGPIIIESWGNRAPAQEGSPLVYLVGVFSIFVDLHVAYVGLASLAYFPELKKWFVCGRSCTSATSITNRLAVHLVTPPHPSLGAPSAASAGDLTMVALSYPRLMVVH
jgi:hypothetical protein